MYHNICINCFRSYTGLSKRNGAKLRESFSLATAGHARLVLSKTVPFFCTTLYCQHQKGEKNGQENHPKNRPNYYFLLNSLPGLGRARDRFRRWDTGSRTWRWWIPEDEVLPAHNFRGWTCRGVGGEIASLVHGRTASQIWLIWRFESFLRKTFITKNMNQDWWVISFWCDVRLSMH